MTTVLFLIAAGLPWLALVVTLCRPRPVSLGERIAPYLPQVPTVSACGGCPCCAQLSHLEQELAHARRTIVRLQAGVTPPSPPTPRALDHLRRWREKSSAGG